MNIKDGHHGNTRGGRRGRLVLALGLLTATVAALGASAGPPRPAERPRERPEGPVRIFVTADERVAAEEEREVRAFGSLSVEYEIDGTRVTLTMAEGEEPTVTLDGEIVPRERLRREKGRLIVLDEEGNELHRLRMFQGLRHGVFRRPRPGEENEWSLSAAPGARAEYEWLAKLPSYGFQFEPPPVMLGVFTRETPEAIEKHLHLEAEATVMITGLHEGLPAQRAGLQQHDIILSVDGRRPVSRGMILEMLRGKAVGDAMTMDVIQAGEPRTFTVELEAFDAQRMTSATLIGESPYGRGRFGWPDDRRRERAAAFAGLIVTPEGDHVFQMPEGGSPIFSGEIQAIIRRLETDGDGGGTKEAELRILLEESKEKIDALLKERRNNRRTPPDGK